MPDQIVIEYLRSPQDVANRRQRPKVVRLSLAEFNDLKALCQLAGRQAFYGFDIGESFQPSAPPLRMLKTALLSGLALVGKNSGKPYDRFRTPEARQKVEMLIAMCEDNLGLSLTKVRAVDRSFGERVPEAAPSALPPQLESAVYRPRGEG